MKKEHWICGGAGCETTYPVWEERSAHRCRYLSFDLLPYLKAGENVLAVRLGNGWYHQTERIAEGKFIFGLPKLWFELTLTDADGRQEWIESDRQTLWHPGGLLKNNLFFGRGAGFAERAGRLAGSGR